MTRTALAEYLTANPDIDFNMLPARFLINRAQLRYYKSKLKTQQMEETQQRTLVIKYIQHNPSIDYPTICSLFPQLTPVVFRKWKKSAFALPPPSGSNHTHLLAIINDFQSWISAILHVMFVIYCTNQINYSNAIHRR